ncbi:MAG: hypothetical protein HOA17_01635 [Candidatus Melainabacteria bacterium]|jgi:signal transduction histidine kinase|nr:hypothetical protein [Candidatus Melainabacteria bacterium]
MISTEIEQIFKKEPSLISELIIKLSDFKNIDDAIHYLVDTSQTVYQARNSFFALIKEESLLIQAQAKKTKVKTEFNININPFNDLVQLKACCKDDYIYLPLNINKQLFAVLVLCYKDQQSKPVFQSMQKELELFAKQVSIFISSNQQIADLQTSNKKLLKQDQLKSQLVSTISHELRTPMANILGFSELMKDLKLDQKHQEYNQEIHNSALRLSNLIDNFLDLSRIEEGHELELNNLEEIELDWLAERAWSMLGAINQSHQITWQFPDDLPTIVVDSEAITRVFLNLFNNAIKYSGDSKQIHCKISHKQGLITVSVEDQGVGLAESELTMIFERFYRVENKQSRHIGGTGLGLWISKKIIEAHGGRIWCESTNQQGSTFNFTLKIGAIENAGQIILH